MIETIIVGVLVLFFVVMPILGLVACVLGAKQGWRAGKIANQAMIRVERAHK